MKDFFIRFWKHLLAIFVGGSTVAGAALYGAGTSSGPSFGCTFLSSTSRACEEQQAPVQIPAATYTNVWCVAPGLASTMQLGETMSVWASATAYAPDASTQGYATGQFQYRSTWTLTDAGGGNAVWQDPTGSTVPQTLVNLPGANLGPFDAGLVTATVNGSVTECLSVYLGSGGNVQAGASFNDTLYPAFSGGGSSSGGSSSGGSSSGSSSGGSSSGSSSGGSSSGGGVAPTITAITPPFGTNAGGTSVTIAGSAGMSTITSCSIGGHALTGLSCSTSCTGTTASSTAGANSVQCTNPIANSNILTDAYAYWPATGWTLALYGESGVTTSGGNITAWADQSGAGNNFANNGTIAWNANGIATGRGAATFSHGSGTYMTSSSPITTFIGAATTSYTVYIVAYPTTATAGGLEAWDGLLSDNVGYWETSVTSAHNNAAIVDHVPGPDDIAFTQNTGGTNGGLTGYGCPVLVTTRMTGGTITISLNSGSTYTGTVSATALNSGAASTTTRIGSSPSSEMTGQIAAVFAWTGDIGNTADTALRPWFAAYYPQLNSGGCTF